MHKLHDDLTSALSKLCVKEILVSALINDHLPDSLELTQLIIKACAAHVSSNDKVCGSDWSRSCHVEFALKIIPEKIGKFLTPAQSDIVFPRAVGELLDAQLELEIDLVLCEHLRFWLTRSSEQIL